jgi:hypothetical protein
VLPKPPDPMATLAPLQNNVVSAADRSITSQMLRASTELQRISARIGALDETLEGTEDRYNRGKITEGQYTMLTTDLYEERNLLKAQSAELQVDREPVSA